MDESRYQQIYGALKNLNLDKVINEKDLEIFMAGVKFADAHPAELGNNDFVNMITDRFAEALSKLLNNARIVFATQGYMFAKGDSRKPGRNKPHFSDEEKVEMKREILRGLNYGEIETVKDALNGASIKQFLSENIDFDFSSFKRSVTNKIK